MLIVLAYHTQFIVQEFAIPKINMIRFDMTNGIVFHITINNQFYRFHEAPVELWLVDRNDFNKISDRTIANYLCK